jgi:hypothetical protein
MKRVAELQPRFVEFIPTDLERGILYVSMQYATASHRCCCGCGSEVVTPLTPTDWKLIFDGETVSLDPSIGNWSFPCQSHYWVRRNKVQWAAIWSRHQVDEGRAWDRAVKQRQFDETGLRRDDTGAAPGVVPPPETPSMEAPRGWWKKLAKVWTNWRRQDK